MNLIHASWSQVKLVEIFKIYDNCATQAKHEWNRVSVILISYDCSVQLKKNVRHTTIKYSYD